MRAGALMHMVAIQQRRTPGAKDTAGQAEDDWSTVCTRYAEITTLSGRELEAAQAMFAEVDTVMVVRYRDRLTAGMRVLFGDEVFELHAALDPDRRRVHLRLLCSSGMNLQGG